MINQNKNINEQELKVKELGVFELRGLAREVGIKSPTTKKRDELITLILEKFKSGITLEQEGKRKGRPFKKLTSIDELVNSISSEQKFRGSGLSYDNIMTFAQDEPIFSFPRENDKVVQYEGIIRKSDFYLSITKKGNWVFFKDKIDNYSKLSKGDKVLVEAKPMVQEGQYIATKILKINDVDADKYNFVEPQEREQIISFDTIPFKDKNIFIGRRNAYMFKEDLYEDEAFNLLSQYCEANGIKLVVLGTNTSFENQIMFKECKFENFTTEYGTGLEINFNNIIDCINYVDKLNEIGSKVLVFVLDIIEVLRVLSKCFKKNTSDDEDMTNIVLQKLMELGKAYSDGSYSTILIGYSELDKDNEIIVNEILKVSKRLN